MINTIMKSFIEKNNKVSEKGLEYLFQINKMLLTVFITLVLLSMSGAIWFIKKDVVIKDEIDGLVLAQVLLSQSLKKDFNTSTKIEFAEIKNYHKLLRIRLQIEEAEKKDINSSVLARVHLIQAKENYQLLYKRVLILWDPAIKAYEKNKNNVIFINKENQMARMAILMFVVFSLIAIYYYLRIVSIVLLLETKEKKYNLYKYKNKKIVK